MYLPVTYFFCFYFSNPFLTHLFSLAPSHRLLNKQRIVERGMHVLGDAVIGAFFFNVLRQKLAVKLFRYLRFKCLYFVNLLPFFFFAKTQKY